MAKPEVTRVPPRSRLGFLSFLPWKTRAPPAPYAGFAEGAALAPRSSPQTPPPRTPAGAAR